MTPLVLIADYASEIPDHIYDNLFNNSLYTVKIYILSNRHVELESKIAKLRYNRKCEIVVVPILGYRSSSLRNTGFTKEVYNFREGFWLKTIERYFTLFEFMQKVLSMSQENAKLMQRKEEQKDN